MNTSWVARLSFAAGVAAANPALAYDPGSGQHSWDSNTQQLTSTLVVSGQTTPQYVAGSIIGNGYITIPNFARIPGGGVDLHQVNAQSASTFPSAGMVLWACDSIPTTTLTDKGVLVLTAADRGVCHRIIMSGYQQITNYSVNSGALIENDGPLPTIRPTSGTAEYFFMTSNGSFTITANNDISFALNGLQD